MKRQILAKFFSSMLILSAKFKYKPAIDIPNYLYWIDEEWSQEWRADFACKCLLQPDMA
jgi:hypothetical protein